MNSRQVERMMSNAGQQYERLNRLGEDVSVPGEEEREEFGPQLSSIMSSTVQGCRQGGQG